MVSFIDLHRGEYGVEPICEVPSIAPSTYYAHRARTTDRALRPERAKRDESLAVDIQRVWQANRSIYGARKVWRQLKREGFEVALCTVERLMRKAGLEGVVRGKRVRTTIPADLSSERPLDLVQRVFRAERPNQLWVADFTYVATWRGMVYVAFVIDAFSRRIVGWRASSSMRTDLALDALEQALHDRETDERVNERLIHHSDRGTQGEFNRSSQHLTGGSCDGQEKEAVGSRRTWRPALARQAHCGTSRGSTTILGGDCGGRVVGGSSAQHGSLTGRGGTMVSYGWRDATFTSETRIEAALGKVSLSPSRSANRSRCCEPKGAAYARSPEN